eukprot:Skav222115  [mRNA]  locus=scaffold1181:403808:409671:- [translate_table: standard]
MSSGGLFVGLILGVRPLDGLLIGWGMADRLMVLGCGLDLLVDDVPGGNTPAPPLFTQTRRVDLERATDLEEILTLLLSYVIRTPEHQKETRSSSPMKGPMVPLGASLCCHAVALTLVLLTLAYDLWQLGLMLLLCWCVLTLGVAANLGCTEMTKLCNAHWLLAASQVFALGSLISINAWRTSVTMSPDLQQLQGAAGTQHVMQHVSSDVLLFQSNEELMIVNLDNISSPLKVSPGLSFAHSFNEVEGRIVFAARQGGKQQVWYINSSQCCEAMLLYDFGSHEVETILVQNSTLGIRTSSSSCSRSQALFSSDWEDTWMVSSCSQLSQSSLLGELFLAALPTTLLSCYCVRRPALFATFFLGLYCIVVMIGLLANSELHSELHSHDFICTSLVVYSSVAYLCAICWQVLRPLKDGRFRDLKDWCFAVISLAFSAGLQLRLDLPASSAAWRWIVFGLVGGVVQMLLGQLMYQRWPKLMGLICLQLCIGRAVLEVQLDVGSAARQTFQLGFLGLTCGILWVALGEWSLDPQELAGALVHPEVPPPSKPKTSVISAGDPAPLKLDPAPNTKVVPDYQREAYEKTQHIQQKLQGAEPVPNVIGLDVDSDVQSEEEGLIGGALIAVSNSIILHLKRRLGLFTSVVWYQTANLITGYLVGRLGLLGVPADPGVESGWLTAGM